MPIDSGHAWGLPTQPDASPARVCAALLDGKDALAVDREVAGALLEVAPWIGAAARANRAFVRRVVAWAARTGADQFVDVGCGLPQHRGANVHELAQRARTSASVLYVDNDRDVVTHARALLATEPGVEAVQSDLAAVTDVVTAASWSLDLSRPVVALMTAVLHHLSDEQTATVMSALSTSLAAGSLLVVSHPTADPSVLGSAARVDEARAAAEVYADHVRPIWLRSHDQVSELVTRPGLTVRPPGVVPVDRWLDTPTAAQTSGGTGLGPPAPVLAVVAQTVAP